jgi:hypothetical protein
MKALILLLTFTSVFAAPVSSTDKKEINDFVKSYNQLLHDKADNYKKVFTKSYFTKYGTAKELKQKLTRLQENQELSVAKSYKHQGEFYIKVQMNEDGKKTRESEVYFVLVKENGRLKLNGLKGEFSAPIEPEN